jgi:hypothetical protein
MANEPDSANKPEEKVNDVEITPEMLAAGVAALS